MKSCSTCGLWQTDAAFYPDRRGRSRDGLHHACKGCERRQAADRGRARYALRKGREQGQSLCQRL